mmetsp:Transcript_1725/g.5015  ORF Transcript_1725/g.5015 Transcript_1725/m.5015 type:complete len:369 (-) Transcript_1725:310-1416(-)
MSQQGVKSPEVEAMQQKLMGYISGALTCNLIALGDRLGLYATMKKTGKGTSADVAAAAGLNERFVREWLHQQASAGVISTDEEAQHFWLTQLQQDLLVNELGPDASPFNMIGMLSQVPNLLVRSEEIDKAFKTGLGYTFEAFGDPGICGVCRSLGVWTRHYLVNSLRAVPGMEEKLNAGIKIADVGCGMGEMVLSIAKAFPKCTVHGYDISSRSLALARQRQQERGMDDAAIEWLNPLEEGQSLPGEPAYDLVLTMDAVHDMTQPETVVSAVRKAVKPDGAYIINDPKGLPTPAANIHRNPAAPVFYGFSCHSCLPSAMSEKGGRGFGTLGFQEAQARELAAATGFTRFEDITEKFQGQMNNVFLLQP